ncbi:hypothetical protein BU25DRAFT_310885, partial [Macroventuria anomochaeta]
ALNKAKSENTPLFISLTDNGKNRAYGCKPASRLVFGPNESDFPGLGKKLSPFEANKFPSLEDLQRLLIDDLHTARKQNVSNSDHVLQLAEGAAQTDDDDEELKLLNGLTDADREASSAVLSFPSPSLDNICGDAKVEYDNVLRESMTMAAVLPRSTLLSLQHSNEGTTFTTLLSGAIAWIIWPPTEHNINILQSSYEAFAEGFDSTKMCVAGELKGGVCLVQTVGEAIRIPPFCPMMCLSLEASVLATYTVVTASQLADMLRKLPLLLAWFKTETDGERKKTHFIAALLPHLSSILQGSFESTDLKKHKYPYLQEGPLHSLLVGWDKIKHAVVSILEPAEAERVTVMWEEFLRKARGRDCWICGKSISNKLRDMRKHFEAKHW